MSYKLRVCPFCYETHIRIKPACKFIMGVGWICDRPLGHLGTHVGCYRGEWGIGGHCVVTSPGEVEEYLTFPLTKELYENR
jgi:hypothetical protein